MSRRLGFVVICLAIAAARATAQAGPAAVDLARFAPPPLPVEHSRRIQRLIDVRGAGGGLLTSRGDRMVFNWSVTGVSQVWRMDGPRSFPVQLTGGEELTTVEAISPDDRWLVVSRDAGGEETPGLFVVGIDGGALQTIVHAPGVRARLAFISDDARWVYYTANDVEPRSAALYRWERATGRREQLLGEPGLWIPRDHRGDQILLAKALGSNHIEYYLFEISTRRLVPLFGQNEKVRYEAAFGRRTGTYLVTHDSTSDFARLYEWKAGRFTPISPEVPHDIDEISIDEARTRIAYTMNEHGYLRLHMLDARTYRELPLPRMPGADNVSGGWMSRDGRFLALSIEGGTQPRTTVFYDWTTRKVIPWRSVSTPEVDTTRFARATLEYYPARDGTKIPMFVRRPASCRDVCPVIVEFHGGPEGQSQPGFNPRAQAYVDAGFVLVQPNVRGSSGYGKAWLDADNGTRRLDVITDIEDCARFIKKEWAKNGKVPKVGVAGNSYGGYATLMAMTYFAGAYDAGVAEAGPANLLTFLQTTAAYRRSLRASEYGDPQADRDALEKLSPLTYADRVRAPLLIVQGANDPRVPVSEAVAMHDALKRRGIPAGLIVFADEGHGASRRSNLVLAFGHRLAFFEKHLKPD
jgi:protease II